MRLCWVPWGDSQQVGRMSKIAPSAQIILVVVQHGEYLICQEIIAAATAAGSLSEDGGAPIG